MKLQKIKMETLNVDNRGAIFKLIEDEDIYSVLLINSEKGAIRANHYHIEDWHYCFILKGSMTYYERELESNGPTESIIINAGEGIITKPLMIHAVKFLEQSIMLTLSPRQRDHFNYEDDLVRYELIQ